jgi:hypothetical protein
MTLTLPLSVEHDRHSSRVNIIRDAKGNKVGESSDSGMAELFAACINHVMSGGKPSSYLFGKISQAPEIQELLPGKTPVA